MKLTSKARYAVMAVADLALYSYLEKNTIILKDIARRQDISISYLEQLFAKLRKTGIVNSLRGPGGGYYLARNPLHISVWEIITAVDETIELSRCDGNGNCLHGEKCITHNLWNELTRTISAYLKQATIGSILKDYCRSDHLSEDVVDKLEEYVEEQRLREKVSGKKKTFAKRDEEYLNSIYIKNIFED